MKKEKQDVSCCFFRVNYYYFIYKLKNFKYTKTKSYLLFSTYTIIFERQKIFFFLSFNFIHVP